MRSKWWAILIFFLLPSFIFLVIRATNDYSWDNWGFGSAQSMLTIRHWARDGFVKHKLLAVPSGYYKDILFLDLPEFKFLAHGIKAGGLIGTRLYYTHYPSGYFIPYALLAQLGFDDRIWFRIMSIIFSFASVFFLYGFIYIITDRRHWIALISVLYYVTSTTFLAYADSLANMPLDDLFKYAILFSSVYSLKSRKFIWPLFFLLAISSYDSTMFVLFWLCVSDLIIAKEIRMRQYLIFFSAPALAFFLQSAQNYWYLGPEDFTNDVLGTLLERVNQSQGILNTIPPIIRNVYAALSTIGYFADIRTRIALPISIIIMYILYRKGYIKHMMPRLLVLFGAGMVYGLVMPVVGGFGYQGRQMAPFLLPIFAIATIQSILFIIKFKREFLQPSALILFAATAMLWGVHVKGSLDYLKDWPNGGIPQAKVDFWKELGDKTSNNEIILGIDKKLAMGTEIFFAQAYADRLILTFPNMDTLRFFKKRMESVIPAHTKFFIPQ